MKSFVPNSKSIFLIILSIVYLFFLVHSIIVLKNKSYIISDTNLCELKDIHLQDKAYFWGGNGVHGAGGPCYTFRDTTGMDFILDGKFYYNIIDEKFLDDTLKYSNIVFNVYTDKDGCEDYYNKSQINPVSVIQLQIGNRNCIDIDKINSTGKSDEWQIVIIITLLFVVVSLSTFLSKK